MRQNAQAFCRILFYIVLIAGQKMYLEKERIVLIAGLDFI